MSIEEVEKQIRESAPLSDRLTDCKDRIGKMCAEGRPPKMSIPAQWNDDDLFICTTLSDAEAVERDRDQWRDLCTRQGMELKAVEVERDALREDKNRIEKVMQLGCQDSESVCPYWQTVKDWEKECDSLEIKNADLQAALAAAQGEVERLRVAIEAGVYLADFVAGGRDMDKCEDCQVSECCSCCIIVAGRFLKKVPHDVAMEIAAQAQEAFGGKP